jgi:dienelactone hydrolase
VTPLGDPMQRGQWPVGLVTGEVADAEQPDRKIPIDIWYPAEPEEPFEETADHPFGQAHRAIPGAPPARGPFPLLAFSHGNSGLRRQSTFLTTHLASHGFVVAAPEHVGNTFFEMLNLDEESRQRVHFAARRQRPRDLAAALEVAIAREQDTPEIDVSRIGVLGHSYGGWTAFKMPRRDARVRAVCGLAPASEPFVGRKAFEPGELPFAPRESGAIPALIVCGIEDVLVDLETSVRPLFERLGEPRALVGLERADHFHFCDGVELLHRGHYQNPRERQPRPTLPWPEVLLEAEAHRAVRSVVAAFFLGALSDTGVEDPFAGLLERWPDAGVLRRLA